MINFIDISMIYHFKKEIDLFESFFIFSNLFGVNNLILK